MIPPRHEVDPIIPGRLYLGGVDSPGRLGHPVDLHVACAYEHPPKPLSAREVLFIPLDDDASVDWASRRLWCSMVAEAARRVAREVCSRKSVLVTCGMGVNRSGLVTALALCYLGLEPGQAIRVLRRRRAPCVLCNPRFVEVVHRVGPDVRPIA